jgi:hypothetical protein
MFYLPGAEPNSDFAIFGDSSVPPPLSLSAPELGSGDPLMTSPLRNAVSSTELLHEQAMARFYQAVAAEEAEKARQRKEVMESKWAESGELSRKLQTNIVELPPKQDLTWHQIKERKLQDRRGSLETAPHMNRASPQRDANLKSIPSQKEPVKFFTDEEAEAVDRTRMETVSAAEKSTTYSILRQRQEERMKMVPKMDKSGEENWMHEREEELKLQEVVNKEEEEQEEEELEEEEYYENDELEEEESLQEVNSEFDEEEELYKSMEEEEESCHPSSRVTRHTEIFAEREDVTYHPRSMVPKASSMEVPLARILERQNSPSPTGDALKSILKHNSRFQDDLEDMIEKKHDLPSRELERSPPRSFRENLPKELLTSFIPDRPSQRSSPRPEPQTAVSPELEEVRMRNDEASLAAEAEAAHLLGELATLKAETHISAAYPFIPAAVPTIPTTKPGISTAAEVSKQKRMLMRKASVEEDTEASRAVADYYGDIIRDHARPKKSVRQYLNTAEMKAAASASQKQEDGAPSPELPTSQTPQPEPELGVEAQVLTAEKSLYDRYNPRVQQPPAPRRKSRSPDVVPRRSRVPSTERSSAGLFKEFPDLAHRISPERKQPEEPEGPTAVRRDGQLQEAEKKWRSVVSYLADLSMFLVACWLYAFKDERLAIPVLVLMVYRQLREAIKRRLPKLPQLPWKRNS